MGPFGVGGLHLAGYGFEYLGTSEPSISHAQCPGPDDADTFPANIRRCGDVNPFGRFMIAVVVSIRQLNHLLLRRSRALRQTLRRNNHLLTLAHQSRYLFDGPGYSLQVPGEPPPRVLRPESAD